MSASDVNFGNCQVMIKLWYKSLPSVLEEIELRGAAVSPVNHRTISASLEEPSPTAISVIDYAVPFISFVEEDEWLTDFPCLLSWSIRDADGDPLARSNPNRRPL